MGRCKDCKFWNRPLTADNSCDKINHLSNDMFRIDVEVSDDSGLSVCFVTNPEFGCNQFEEKGPDAGGSRSCRH